MTIRQLAEQAVGYVKNNRSLHASDVADAYTAHLEKQGADHGICEMFYQLMNNGLKKEGLTPLF